MDKDTIEQIKKDIKKSKRIVFLGGAGVSTASGIKDFRSPEGIYNCKSKYGVPFETMLSHTFFRLHPKTFYDFYWESMIKDNAKPNKAHFALANYQGNENGRQIPIITQNIDSLHSLAGSKEVYELHGSTARYHCEDCNKFYSYNDIQHYGVPRCSKCGGIIKPNVTLYEEPLDNAVVNGAISTISRGDFLIVGGTSLNVYPAAGLIYYFEGRNTLLINKEPTPLDSYFKYIIRDDIGETLEVLLSD